MRITSAELRRSDPAFQAAVGLALAKDARAQQEHRGQAVPDKEDRAIKALAHADCAVLVRITRVLPTDGRHGLDDDNLSGGCKQLRDAIATALGRSGDSASDGFRWEYAEAVGPEETLIEIFRDGEKEV